MKTLEFHPTIARSQVEDGKYYEVVSCKPGHWLVYRVEGGGWTLITTYAKSYVEACAAARRDNGELGEELRHA